MATFTTRKCGIFCALFAFLLIIIAFCTPYWLVNDEWAPDKRFCNLGLWEICLNMTDPYNLYDHRWEGCWWIPLEDLWYMREQLISPSFFVSVQVFFTLCMVFSLIASIMVFMYAFCVAYDRRVCMLRTLSGVLLAGGICGLVAVITFGVYGDGRDWMPYPDHNYLSWSFALGVVGTFFDWVASLLFWIEANRIVRKERKEEAYAMQSKA